MDLAVIATVFGLIFLAELPDKTALASLVLGTRYRPLYVFAGAAAAFTVHVTLAVALGSLLTLLPHRILQAIVGALFLLGAVLLLRGRHGKEDENLAITEGMAPTFLRVSSTSFLVILVAEFGDLTQIVTANLAAKYHDPLSVGSARSSDCGRWRRWRSPRPTAQGRADHRGHPGRGGHHGGARRDQHRRRDPRLSEAAAGSGKGERAGVIISLRPTARCTTTPLAFPSKKVVIIDMTRLAWEAWSVLLVVVWLLWAEVPCGACGFIYRRELSVQRWSGICPYA